MIQHTISNNWGSSGPFFSRTDKQQYTGINITTSPTYLPLWIRSGERSLCYFICCHIRLPVWQSPPPLYRFRRSVSLLKNNKISIYLSIYPSSWAIHPVSLTWRSDGTFACVLLWTYIVNILERTEWPFISRTCIFLSLIFASACAFSVHMWMKTRCFFFYSIKCFMHAEKGQSLPFHGRVRNM